MKKEYEENHTYAYGETVFVVLKCNDATVYQGSYVERSHGYLHMVDLNSRGGVVYVEDGFLFTHKSDAIACASIVDREMSRETKQNNLEEQTSISGIWKIPYVCEIGIEKHCRLILNLIDEAEKYKASVVSDTEWHATKMQLKCEMADLFIILEKYFSLKNGHLIEERKALFNKYQEEDEKYWED